MKKYIFPTALVLLLPQFALACSGGLFDPSVWLVIISGLLACVHGAVSFLLSGNLDAIKKGRILRQYTQGIFYFYIALSLVVFFSFPLKYAFAFSDPRSAQEIYIDSLSGYVCFAWLVSAVITIICVLAIRAKSVSEERKIRIGKFSSSLLFLVSLCAFLFLAYALWVVAPTLSDKNPFMPPPPPAIVPPSSYPSL